MNKAILTSFTILCLLSILFLMGYQTSVKASPDVIHVPTDYLTIQEAINAANPGDFIFVYNGTYYENVVVNKTVSLVGEDRVTTIIDGGGTGSVINVTANNVSIKGFTIKRSGTRPYDSGIFVDHSSGNDISRNIITNNYDGISFYSSINNVVSGNTITNNNHGISLVLYSSNNTIYCNNFNNTYQVWSDSTNVWNDDDEGNYWSDYAGQDLNGDGIGDTPYVIDVNNQDNYPLMGMFSDFKVTWKEETYHVTTICNSTISEFRFEVGRETGNKIISFSVTGEDGTVGFCRAAIPTELMNYPLIVLVDEEEIVPTLLDVSDETRVYLYFTYIHSSHTITIISSKTLYLYNELLDKYAKLQIDFDDLNSTYHELLDNYSTLLGNYSQLLEIYNSLNTAYQESTENYSQLLERHGALNASYQEHLLDYSELQANHTSLLLEHTQNIRSLIYIFIATTAIFIITTIYLSKRAHAGKTKVFEYKNRC